MNACQTLREWKHETAVSQREACGAEIEDSRSDFKYSAVAAKYSPHAFEILGDTFEILAASANPFAEYLQETGRRFDRHPRTKSKYSRISIK